MMLIAGAASYPLSGDLTVTTREEQIAQAEEILADQPAESGFVKRLFFGEYAAEKLLPYPAPPRHDDRLTAQLRAFLREEVDPVAIDRQAEIPQRVIAGLGQLGILGACLPKACGGLELTQTAYCRLLEVLGAHCASTALFVNAHHSIGPRAIVLFGNEQQKRDYLPKLATGEWISAFALTEPEAGSDAANVQTVATPTADGLGYRITGQKRWITNGGVAQVLTLMARTPAHDGRPEHNGSGKSKITAFIVTPDMPGFEVVEPRMEKMGVRGTATGRLAFHDMYVPRENVLGERGKGLKVALTVLDFGRTTFGASCTGAAKFCVSRAVQHARERVQFGRPLGDFELVKQKLAFMQAATFAMEACTYQTAALMDSGHSDFILETAMLKVFSTEMLWKILHETFQLHGGLAYFTDQPFERMVRDHRIDLIGEGANDVLRAFTALVGMRDVGLELESILKAIKAPLGNFSRLGQFAGRRMGALLTSPPVRVRSSELRGDAAHVARLVGTLGSSVEKLLATHQREIVERQYQLGRIADAAIELYVSACVLQRLDALLDDRTADAAQLELDLLTGRYYLNTAHRRIRHSLADLGDHDDEATTALADRLLRTPPDPPS
jgi:acyl-CoA dehydrogenase family protein 9